MTLSHHWTDPRVSSKQKLSPYCSLQMLAEDLTSFSDMEQEQYERFIERLLLIGNVSNQVFWGRRGIVSPI